MRRERATGIRDFPQRRSVFLTVPAPAACGENAPMALEPESALEVARVQTRLASGSGGYELVHESPGLEVGVYVPRRAGARPPAAP